MVSLQGDSPLAYTLLTPADRQEMLKAVGASSVEQLLDQIPADIRLGRPLALPAGLCEQDLTELTAKLAAKNCSADSHVCFLGGGAYDHFIPAVVDAIASRGEYYTAYTPYQAEASQGTLQVGFEFQSLICELTGLDVANASLYDGASAVAEAVLMARALTDRPGKVVIAGSVHPEYRATLATYLTNLSTELVTVPVPSGVVDPAEIRKHVDANTSAVVVQHPNFFGCLEDVEQIAAATKAAGALFVAVFDPISLGVLKRPGDYGADIAVAEGQGLGVPLGFGGPYLGILACRQEYVRKIPGRIVGQTTDRRGKRCWVLTLQTREQHIRRDKATSNICTNQALLALRASVYLTALGPAGLRETADLCARKAHYAAAQLAKIPGVKLAYDKPFFKEFVVRVPGDPAKLLADLRADGFLAGLQIGAHDIAVAVTEKRSKDEIDRLAAAWARRAAR
ncbi:MAG: aminomethyl-transferring glycine dehydrogenase subunit GcvPA [Gemmataceae bacterium]|nr:aminomethyl-transferring glycine dehydrogenase subunit GcvPA [Gemmataceae bacterium]